jgi:hypothetical protein
LDPSSISEGITEEKLKSDGDATPKPTYITSNEFVLPEGAGNTLNDILTPQKALPSTMTLVPDDSPSFLREPELHSTTVQLGQQRRKDVGGRSTSEQEIWVPDPGELLD